MRTHLLGLAQAAILGFALAAAACGDKDSDDDDKTGPTDSGSADSGDSGDTDSGDTGPTDSGDSGSDTDLPPDPTPFTLTASGAYSGNLVFNEPTCTYPLGSSNFRITWRDSSESHVFVLIAELLGTFEGAGTYTTAAHGARVKLQEEAGGQARYYGTESTDTVSMTVDHVDEDRAWGEFTVDALHDSGGGTLTLSPQPIPIWCPTLN